MKPFLEKVKAGSKEIETEESGMGLERIYLGITNFEGPSRGYGLPHSIPSRMNTPDIPALYIGIMGTKYFSIFRKEKYRELLELAESNFPGLISQLVSFGYKYHGIRKMKDNKKGFFEFPAEPGSLTERMREIPEDDKQKFLRSLKLHPRDFALGTDLLLRTTELLGYELVDLLKMKKDMITPQDWGG